MCGSHWPNRRTSRLPGYDYRQPGYYFVTGRTGRRHLIFENPAYYDIAERQWWELTLHFNQVALDEFVVMPNHIHGLIAITDDYEAEDCVPPVRRAGMPASLVPGSLPVIVRSYKAGVAREINRLRGRVTKVWQGRYYDHIVRSEDELDRIRSYILANPDRWQFDSDNPGGAPDKFEREFWADLEASANVPLADAAKLRPYRPAQARTGAIR